MKYCMVEVGLELRIVGIDTGFVFITFEGVDRYHLAREWLENN